MIKEGVESSVHADISRLVRILTQILMPCTMGTSCTMFGSARAKQDQRGRPGLLAEERRVGLC